MATTWKLTNHACRVCFGRVLTSADGKISRCAECGIQAPGGYRSICACGAHLRTGASMGLRCDRNPNPTPETPQEVIVRAK